MPEIFRMFGIRFYFWSNDHEPIHVHISNGDGEAVFKIETEIVLRENRGVKRKDIRLAESIIEENKDLIVQRWKEFFNK